jgi:hypothetical protein
VDTLISCQACDSCGDLSIFMMVKKDGYAAIAEVFAACHHTISQPRDQQLPQIESIIQEFDDAKETQRSQPDHQVMKWRTCATNSIIFDLD